jgi:hypothetical protein
VGYAANRKTSSTEPQAKEPVLALGKEKGKVVTAIGRELLGFIWAIGVAEEAAQKKSERRAA